MPALAKTPARLPRFVPHVHPGASTGAGAFSNPALNLEPTPASDFARNSPDTALPAEDLHGLAHDARNVLSSLMLYCDLLATPGVLAGQHSHYAQELRSIAKNATEIIERMAAAQPPAVAAETQALPAAYSRALSVPLPAVPVADAAEELRHLRPLLTAFAGPAIQLSIATMPCPGRTALAVEDLTRILINLVRNAADAMPAGGRIRITARYDGSLTFADADRTAETIPDSILITVADNGPGIPAGLREQVFDLGFTTRESTASWPAPRRRGLGLNIVRNLVQAAGGTVRAVPVQPHGARFEISLPMTATAEEPVTSGTCPQPLNHAFIADSGTKGCIECQ